MSKFVIRIEFTIVRVSGRWFRFYDSTVSTLKEMSSFYRLDKFMNWKFEYVYFAIFKIYESFYDGFRDPVMKITHN